MPRFAILEHDHPMLHWDLLLEWEGCLRAWRLPELPQSGGAYRAEALPDHRLHYLDYEGPISGGRGTVRRSDQGQIRWRTDLPDQLIVELRGKSHWLASWEAGVWSFVTLPETDCD